MSTRRALGAVLPALAAPFAAAPLTGEAVVDRAWAVVLIVTVALAASHAKRGPLLIVSALTALMVPSHGAVALVAALVAVIAAALSTTHLQRRAPFTRGLSGGAAMVSVLAATADLTAPMAVIVWTVVVGGVVGSAWKHLSRQQRRSTVWTVACVLAFVVAVSTLAGVGAYRARRSVDDGTAALRIGLSMARVGEVDGADRYLEAARILLEDAQRDVHRFGALGRTVPFVAQNVAALDAVLSRASDAAGQAALTAGGTSSERLAVHHGRIDLDAVSELQRPLHRLAGLLGDLDTEIDRRIRTPLVPAFKDGLARVAPEVSRARADAEKGAEAAHVVPEILGGSGARRYLVLFTSPAEARGRFGFPGSFAEVVVTDGVLELREHGSVSTLLVGQVGTPVSTDDADDRLAPYLHFGVARDLRSTTIPPDFPTSARAARDVWEHSGRPRLDGVLRFDPAALAELLRFTGPVQVAGVSAPLTPDNLERFLLVDQYVQYPFEQAPRRELLETVADVTFERLQTADLPAPQVLADRFGALSRSGHIQAVSFSPRPLDFLERIGLTGSFGPPASDGLLVTTVNSAGNKIDTFLDRSITYDAEVRDGHLVGTVSVELRNRAPASDLPFYVIGSSTQPVLPLGTNRLTLFVYTAVPADGVVVDGRSVTGRPVRTGGRWLYQVLVELPPGGRSTVELHLSGELAPGPYRLVLDPGGGVTPDVYDVSVDVDGKRRIEVDGALTMRTSLP